MKEEKEVFRRVSISLPAKVVEGLDALAKREVRSRSQQATLFLTKAVSRNATDCQEMLPRE